MQIINTLVPIFLLIGTGTFLRQQKMFSEDFFKGLGKLVFYVGLPLLLFNKISTAVFNIDDVKKIIIVTLLSIAAIFIIAYIGMFQKVVYSFLLTLCQYKQNLYKRKK